MRQTGVARLNLRDIARSYLGYSSGIDLWKIMDIAEDIVRPIMQKPVRIGKASSTMGYAGVYSSFLLHADKAAQQFGIDPRDVPVEVGKRRAVGGQENILVEIAMSLAQKNAEVEASPSRRLA